MGCKARTPVTTVVRDSVMHHVDTYSQVADSVILRDTLRMESIGDTVRIVQVRYRDRVVRSIDTLRILDTLRITSRVEVPVPVSNQGIPVTITVGIALLLFLLIITRTKHIKR